MARPAGTYAVIDTTEGKIVCRLFEKEAPITTKNFTDLAEGKRQWKDNVSGKGGS
ncbi:MAG TPA: peptidylprolyl isomerase, partial [Verrucomicrobiae bacterium]|nr:peptidylprolyl isomerase [Verrucomicrobiae bacterium]